MSETVIDANDVVVIEEIVRRDYDPARYIGWDFKPGQHLISMDDTLYAIRLKRMNNYERGNDKR